MKQHPKRKDLIDRHVLLPEEIDNWINEICAKTKESRSLAITRLLTMLKNMQENLSACASLTGEG